MVLRCGILVMVFGHDIVNRGCLGKPFQYKGREDRSARPSDSDYSHYQASTDICLALSSTPKWRVRSLADLKVLGLSHTNSDGYGCSSLHANPARVAREVSMPGKEKSNICPFRECLRLWYRSWVIEKRTYSSGLFIF